MERLGRASSAGGEAGSLRFVTYLAPGLPVAFFEGVVAHAGATLGCRTTLVIETGHSGPLPEGPDPFSSNQADVGFMCAPSYGWLRRRSPSPAEVLGAAPVFSDPRAGGRPIYFSDVVVRDDHPARSLADLSSAVWAYNDPCSLSGYYAVLDRLAREGVTELPPLRHSGSHRASIDLVIGGQVEAASIDANVLALLRGSEPELMGCLRMIGCLGPYPVQPVVVRAGMASGTKAAITAYLLSMAESPTGRRWLSRAGVVRFSPTSEAPYHVAAKISASCERVFGASPIDLGGEVSQQCIGQMMTVQRL